MTADAISIVVPHYGEAADTLPLIQQLTSQTCDLVQQVIVVDDASPEPFPETSELPGTEVVRRTTNGGFAAAVNSGLAVAHGEKILVLNSDVSVPEDFVARLAEGAQEVWPAVVTTRVRESYGERCMGHSWPTNSAVLMERLVPFARFHGYRWYEHRTSNLIETVGIAVPTTVDWVTGICMLFPRVDALAVGGLDERYFMNCEEVDLQKRLHDERGLPAVILPAPVIAHVGGGSSPSSKRAGWILDARMRYAEKWSSSELLAVGLVVVAGINLVWNSGRKALGREVDAIDVFRQEMTLIRHAWRTRR